MTPAQFAGSSPLVAAAFPDLMRIAPELLIWLHAVEARARDLLTQLDARVAVQTPLDSVMEAREETWRFLHDDERGAFRRTLRRPPDQLTLGSVGFDGFRRCVELLFEQGERSIATDRDADALRATIRLYRKHHAPRLPWFWHALLAEARLTGDHVRRLRSPNDVRRAVLRADWLVDQLLRVETVLPTDPSPPPAYSSERPSVPSLPELRASAQLRIVERDLLRERRSADGHLRDLVRRHRDRLVMLAGRALPARTAMLQLLEELAALEDGSDAPTRDHVESSVHLWLLAAAGHHLDEAIADEGWTAPIPVAAELRNSDFLPRSNELGVLPIGASYALISRHVDSPVRVVADDGALLAARLVGRSAPWVASDAAERDFEPLFDGFERGVSSYYTAVVDAQLTVVASFRDERYARITTRGRIDKIATPVWESASADAEAIRVLVPWYLVDASEECASASIPDAQANRVAGFTTHRVRTPIGGRSTATLRIAEPSTSARCAALANEQELFRRLSELPDLSLDVPQIICKGRLAADTAQGVLYRMPAALTEAAADRFWRRLKDDDATTHSVIVAVAQLMLASRRQDFVIGLVHQAMLRPSLRVRDGHLVPTVLLWQAPLSAPLNSSFVGSIPVAQRRALSFPRLGLRSPLPCLELGERADSRVDGRAFAAFALDLISPAVEETELASWDEMVATLRDGRTFRNIGFDPTELATALASDDHRRLWGEVQRIANSRQLEVEAAITMG